MRGESSAIPWSNWHDTRRFTARIAPGGAGWRSPERPRARWLTMREEALSLGWRTDLIFARFDAEVRDGGDHLLVRTDANPTFWWGNFLLFDRAPRDGDFGDWMARFEQAFPQAQHRAFGVDARAPFALPDDFAAAGFALNEATVLTLAPAQLRPSPKPLPQGLRFEALELPRDAAAVVDEQVDVDSGRYEPAGYRVFAERQMLRYGAMQDAGLGHWFGLWADGEVAASCGLFRDPARDDGLGRFQYVSTHPRWRRRGLCTALVNAVCRHGFERMGLRTLVMVADPADVAIGVYESLGFVRGTSAWQIERAPQAPNPKELP